MSKLKALSIRYWCSRVESYGGKIYVTFEDLSEDRPKNTKLIFSFPPDHRDIFVAGEAYDLILAPASAGALQVLKEHYP